MLPSAAPSLIVHARDDAGRQRFLCRFRAEARRAFDDAAYRREDTAWYRSIALEGFVFLYESTLYDRQARVWRIEEFIRDGREQFGGYDLVVLWQPYPRGGIDERNQFDFWRDLPGGLAGLRAMVGAFHRHGIRVQLNYLPWDQACRDEGAGDAEAIAAIVREVGADGIYGDTMAGFDAGFQAALDRVGPGLTFSSEGSPSLAAAQTLTGCWGQNLLPIPPAVPTVRFVEPRHSVRLVDRDSLDRTFRAELALFWGMGQVVWENVFGTWNPYTGADGAAIRRTTALYRAFAPFFHDPDWESHLAPTPEVYVNVWRHGARTIYTVLSTARASLTGVPVLHLVAPGRFCDHTDGRILASTAAPEGEVLRLDLEPFVTHLVSEAGAASTPPVASAGWSFFERGLRGPERNLPMPPPAVGAGLQRGGAMVRVPGGSFRFCPVHLAKSHQTGCYDHRWKPTGGNNLFHHQRTVVLPGFLMDAKAVTNRQYHEFLRDSGYRPVDPSNFLKHWHQVGDPVAWEIPPGLDDHPVVYVELDDARAYAAWAGKRLPTEEEWQYAAQGGDGRNWPWGDEFDPARVNGRLDERFFGGALVAADGGIGDDWRADAADHSARYRVPAGGLGALATGTMPVEALPAGASACGCLGMSGNVWEWTESERDDGHTRYAILKGGSYLSFRRSASHWYTHAGPLPCDVHEKMLLLCPGLDRCSTIGFRCLAPLPPKDET